MEKLNQVNTPKGSDLERKYELQPGKTIRFFLQDSNGLTFEIKKNEEGFPDSD